MFNVLLYLIVTFNLHNIQLLHKCAAGRCANGFRSMQQIFVQVFEYWRSFSVHVILVQICCPVPTSRVTKKQQLLKYEHFHVFSYPQTHSWYSIEYMQELLVVFCSDMHIVFYQNSTSCRAPPHLFQLSKWRKRFVVNSVFVFWFRSRSFFLYQSWI